MKKFCWVLCRLLSYSEWRQSYSTIISVCVSDVPFISLPFFCHSRVGAVVALRRKSDKCTPPLSLSFCRWQLLSSFGCVKTYIHKSEAFEARCAPPLSLASSAMALLPTQGQIVKGDQTCVTWAEYCGIRFTTYDRFESHMKVEHGASANFSYLLAGCLMTKVGLRIKLRLNSNSICM